MACEELKQVDVMMGASETALDYVHRVETQGRSRMPRVGGTRNNGVGGGAGVSHQYPRPSQ